MKRIVAACLSGLMTGTAGAEAQYETLYQHKAWEVQVVGFEDGSFSCLAQVSGSDESFTIWADANSPVKLQFYSSEWDFGEGDTADLEVEIDRRSPWTLNAAELYLQSVLFTLPDSDIGTKFLLEVVKGSSVSISTYFGIAARSVMWRVAWSSNSAGVTLAPLTSST